MPSLKTVPGKFDLWYLMVKTKADLSLQGLSSRKFQRFRSMCELRPHQWYIFKPVSCYGLLSLLKQTCQFVLSSTESWRVQCQLQ